MKTSEMDGIFLCGVFKRLEQIMYGVNHAKRPNEPVPGMMKIVVGVEPGLSFEQTASFDRMDLATREETVVSQVVGDGSQLIGRRVYLRIAVRANKQGYANMEARNLYIIGDTDLRVIGPSQPASTGWKSVQGRCRGGDRGAFTMSVDGHR
jgi:hypothetical protein